jgi:two-component system cell cycle sensor histidine kinase/response regulator CckA
MTDLSEQGSTSVGQVPMERLRTIFDGMFDGVWLIGNDGRTTYVNEAMAGLLGTTAPAMYGHPITDYLSAEFRPVAEALIDRQRDSPGERVDMRFLRADGGDVWTLVAASPIETAEGLFVGSMMNVSDVTGKRAAQNQALQNQKLEAIGAFAAGITHDINNLLTTIRGYAELVHAELSDGELRSDIDQVIASADRAQVITGRLLAFTRGQALQPVVVDPAQVLIDIMPMLGSLLSDDVELGLDAEPGRSLVRVDPIALNQVLVNLAVNAQEAMQKGGKLTIALDEIEARPREALGGGETRQQSVRIRVMDTGVGMDEATLGRLFDPFFTSKEVGKGPGLGLSSVYGLVGQSGGSIEVESDIAQGTTFTVLLPRLEGSTEHQVEPDASPREVGAGIVLVVEDDLGVREFARRVLHRAGHTLLIAANGQEAVELAGRWEGAIEVLLTDIVMPGMHGQMLARKLLEVRPEVQVIYMSGYAEDALPPPDQLATPVAFVAKPFSSATLIDAVARAIAEGRRLRR